MLLYCRVPWLCCVRVDGADAYDFLRRQLTNDPPAGPEHFTFAAWNDAKGRVRALFHIVRDAAGPLLIAERDGIDAVLAKLRIFVMRSDVRFVTNPGLEVAAVVGDAGTVLEARGIALAREPGALGRASGLLWLRQSDELLHVVGPSADLDRLGAELEAAPIELAARAEIRAGLPYVGAALAERFVPQMLNLDRLGGVAFDKGCYPGQEVVARLHHLGSVKRRMRRLVSDRSAEPAPLPGAAVVDADGNEVGEVVRAVVVDRSLELLAVVQRDAADDTLFLGERRVALQPAPLPQDDGEP